MKRKLVFGLFMTVAVLQFAVPVGQIRKYEEILRSGTAYKFRTEPVDPSDAFRGRYVALNYADTLAAVQEGDSFEYRSPVYVTLQKDDAGFAIFGKLSGATPAKGDYLRVEYLHPDQNKTTSARFCLPFDKFFMEETKAPKAEAAYWKHGNRPNRKMEGTYVIVRVKDGRGVIENLYIKGKPIQNFLDEEAAAKR